MRSENHACVSQKIVILGTGGTIAGLSLIPGAGGAYRAAQVGIEDLLKQSAAMPTKALTKPANASEAVTEMSLTLVSEQLAQVDSKDMDEDIWQRLLTRLAQLQADPLVQGVVITHGTDTLEETGFLLQACWPEGKPIVLTCAMKPADAPDADGPANLKHAIQTASEPHLTGVHMVCDGQRFAGHAFQKLKTDGVQPFVSQLPDGTEPAYVPLTASELSRVLQAQVWPRVEIVMNHAGAEGSLVRALLTAPGLPTLHGLVLAGTGQGTYSEKLGQALRQAQAQGVRVCRTTRALLGSVQPVAGAEFPSVPWTPVKARVAMMLDALSGRTA